MNSLLGESHPDVLEKPRKELHAYKFETKLKVDCLRDAMFNLMPHFCPMLLCVFVKCNMEANIRKTDYVTKIENVFFIYIYIYVYSFSINITHLKSLVFFSFPLVSGQFRTIS